MRSQSEAATPGQAANSPFLGAAVVGALFLLTVAAFSRIPLLPAIGDDLGLSALGIGLLGSIFGAGRLVADFPTGKMSDRIGAGPMVAMASGLVALGAGLLAVARVPFMAYLSSFILGLGSTWVLTAAMAHFAKVPRVRRGTAMSLFAAGLLVGQSVGPAVGGAVAGDGDWRRAMFLAAGLAALVGVGVSFLRVSPPQPVPPAGSETARAPVPRRVLALVYLIPAAQFASAGGALQTLVPIIGDRELDLGPAAIGLALGVGGICRLLSALVSGRISDRVSRRAALIPGQVLQVLGMASFLVGGLNAWYVGVVLLTLGSAGVNLGATILADLSEGGEMGSRLGAFRFTGDLAFVVAPFASGWLYESWGRVASVIPLVVFAAVVAVGVTVVIPETHRQ